MNRIVEKWMYRSRWLFAPVYIGLSLGLLALTIKFFQSMYEILPNIFALSEAETSQWQYIGNQSTGRQ